MGIAAAALGSLGQLPLDRDPGSGLFPFLLEGRGLWAAQRGLSPLFAIPDAS